MITEVSTKRSLEFEALITYSKQLFENELKNRLNLILVTAPLYVPRNSGLNDDLNGYEKAVSFELQGETHEIVHSLAKWKRWYLGELNVPTGKGIVTNMRAVRADEITSPIHSHYVDQWDWEKVIHVDDRNIDTLIRHGKAVYEVLKKTEAAVSAIEVTRPTLPERLKVIHSEELLQLYPEFTPKEREDAIAAKYGAVLLIGIGGELSNGEAHDLRAPDYDDWTTEDSEGFKGLNADLLVWDTVRGASLEISSMGIRVDKAALIKQLKLCSVEDRISLPFHQTLVGQKLPYTIGGGIGQSRVAMFVTKRADITEVQPKIT